MNDKKSISTVSNVAAFLKQVQQAPKPIKSGGQGEGRLIFALDATASRQPTWDMACEIQSEMFIAAASLGGLSLQLCYYKGFKQFFAAPWQQQSAPLLNLMSQVKCLGGRTQIERVLRHGLKAAQQEAIHGVVFVGDCMEENADILCDLAGQLGLKRVPLFIFQEGHDPVATRCFNQLAKLSQGAHCQFDQLSGEGLKALLQAIAIYASGGRKALGQFGRDKQHLKPLLRQLRIEQSS